MNDMKVEKARMLPVDMVDENIKTIIDLFPNAAKEVKTEDGVIIGIDFDVLKQEMTDSLIAEKQERYQMTWPDKKESIILSNKSVMAALRPLSDKSVDFDKTKNIYIEGDNLDALKVLRESYFGKIKMILIDPPYNTGSDLIYEDDFAQSTKSYLEKSGQYDEQGNKMIQNNETNGRFHTDWLNMMYPRLKVAKDLLSDEGIILIHIDENEFVNLIKICDEIFGSYNYIENFIWIKNSTKNLSKTTSTNHEYVVCYCKNKTILEESGLLRVSKPGLSDVNSILEKANKEKWSFEKTEEELKSFYSSHPELKGISNYDRVDFGPTNEADKKLLKVYTLDNASAPKSTGRAATYDVIHPKTGRACKCPSTGWRFTRSTMDEHIKNNLIYFYDDETHVPRFKRYLDTVTTEVIKSTFEDFNEGKKDLLKLFNGRCPFDNPKPVSVEKRFINLLKDGDIVLDFFSGSGTTAQAVYETNMEKGININFIAIQLPEICDVKSEAFDMGYRYLTEVSEDRIVKCIKKLKEKNTLITEYQDFGFRVFKLDSTNMNDVYYNPKAITQNLLEATVDNIKPDRTSLDLLFQVMLECGALLSSKIEEKMIYNKKVYIVEDNYIAACFDDDLNDKTIEEIAKLHPIYACFKGSSFDSDSSNINAEQIFKTYSPNTEKVKVI